MEQRVDIEHAQPEAWKALYNLAIILHKGPLSTTLKNLIMVRVSQINSCAFCINMHTKEALRAGETQQRLLLLNAWRETIIFTDEEKAVLALAEEVTLIHRHGVSDAVYKQAQQFFNEETIAEIIMSVVLINGWNRIAVSTHKPLGE